MLNTHIEVKPSFVLKQCIPYLLIFFVGVTWGITFSLSRMAIQFGASPTGLTFCQAFGGSLLLLLVCFFRGKFPVFNRQYFKHYLIIALVGTAIPSTMFFYAAAHVPAGILAITIALVPMLTYLVTWTLGIDAFQVRRIAGILLGFIAILLLSIPDSSLPEPGMVKWVMLSLVAAAFYAIESVYLEVKVPAGADLIGLLCASLLITAILILPIVYYKDAFFPISFPFQQFEWVLLSLALVSSAAYVVFLYTVKIAGAVFASMAGYIITISGVFWGILFFQEVHSNWVWASLMLMMIGMALVTPRNQVSE
ncbi:MAG: drug/metabolite transporter (DMT)-like permease [Gammaproteobacteria bacterium]|jgi:drug/metabolite transporter (DMT)-like permease